MNDILIFGEIRNGELKRVIKELLTAGRIVAEGTGGSIDAVLVGKGALELSKNIDGLGIRKTFCVDDNIVEKYSTEGYAKVLSDLIAGGSYGYVFFGATAMGRDLSPRVAARVDGVMFSDCVDLRFEDGRCIAKRPVYSGKLFVEIAPVGTPPVFITIRPNNLPPADPAAGETEAVTHPSGVMEDMIRALATEIIPMAGGRPDITEAEVIIAGGRAMKDSSNFEILGELADLLGGAVGASRAVVDAGYVPQSIQVGQTGKIVNPKLYIACGISGAIQHLAGMRTSKVIVAINKDSNAPIFERAHYGIVGDLFEVVPALTEEIRKLL